MAGCGVRGIRFLREVGNIDLLVLNDLNPQATELTTFNVTKNKQCGVIVENVDANLLLSAYASPSKRFDVIDLDPYGSPSPFLDSAVRALRNGGLLALTATDLAPLCGVNSLVCIRKYLGKSLRTEYCHELAIRLVINVLVFTAIRHKFGVKVLLSHSTDHYVRVYAQLIRGAKVANDALMRIGYLLHCFHCLHRKLTFGFANFPERVCEKCGETGEVAGPLWLGKLVDRGFCEQMTTEARTIGVGAGKRTMKLLSMLTKESEAPPTYFVVDRVSEKLGLPPPPKRKVIDGLINKGYKTVETHFNPGGIKTGASIEAVEKTLRELLMEQTM
jgi:tRNA (guanine26-N2/guanine27-N2)-dimethyltransferase